MPKLKFATESNGTTKFYPISITPGIIDTQRNQRLNVTIANLYDALFYEDVYIGAAAASSTIEDADYHHDTILRGRPIAISDATSGSRIWVIMPASYSPAVLMSGSEVPMTLDSTTTISGKSFKIWKSTDTYTGSFNLYLF